MASRKRAHQDISTDDSTPEQPTMLKRLRDTWHFAALLQYIQFFGSVLKIDNELDIDMLEEECLKPNSDRLAQLGLTMLKWVSSHRGLTTDIFDEYTRRQYLAKAPHLNPFGEEEDANKFTEFDIFTKLEVLYQLSVWTLNNPDRIRERMEEKTDREQASWRVDPIGEDKDGRRYFLLDDNRLYRMTDPPSAKPPPKKAKAKPKPPPKKAGSRASKRQKTTGGDVLEQEEVEEADAIEVDENNGLGGAKWECLAVTLPEYQNVIDKLRKSKNADERDMIEILEDQAMPELVKAEESKARKEAKRQKDLDSLSKMATAKRSSRLADKQEKQKADDEAKAAELKRQEDLEMAHREQKRQMKQEQDRESRMMTREQRIKDREVKRILHEEELAKLKERSQSVESGEAGRMSERNRANMLQKKQADLEKLKEDEGDWYFDCEVCGVHGANIDDGTQLIACDQCGVWQHSTCHNVTPAQADNDDFKFVCDRCSRPKTGIKLKLHKSQGEASPPGEVVTATTEQPPADVKPMIRVPQAPDVSAPAMGTFKPSPARSPLANGYPQSQTSYKPLPATAYMNSHRAQYASQQPQPSFPPPQPTQHSASSFHSPYAQTPSQRPPSSGYQSNATNYQRPPSSGHHAMMNGVNAYPQPRISPSNGLQPPPSASFTSPPHHAPTPNLSATQGNTSLHFSSTQQPPGSPSRHGPSAHLANSPRAAHAYSPSSNFPQQSAVSPTKHASPPHSSFGSNANSSFGQPNLTPRSPSKTYLPPPQQQTPGHVPASSMSMNLDGAPTLSPSVNAGNTSNAVPVKKMTPSKSPVAEPERLQNGLTGMPGLSNGSAGSPTGS